ncbi:MAG: DEAD/DEAH box helicase [Planctomycetes bacterium]|nr:DEAD/DEAH box helicase [Planctomycetota bacterium]
MRIAALEAFGLDDCVLDVWKSAGHDRLLPVQEMAIRQGKVLDGQNVVVFSPTSSGKTFVGEMAAVRMARQNKRVVYLVPQKALAEEKYREFKRQYGSLGIRIVISTRDRKEYDRDIRRGHFHIAVVVFEKMQGLLVVSPTLLRNVGLVVIDELQMLGDRTRGAGLEILLTKIKTSAAAAQIIGLSAVLGSSHQLARWLGAGLCRLEQRPVELRKGVLCQGTFHYIEHNSGTNGQEAFATPEDEVDAFGMLIHQARCMAGKGEQSLVFCKSKQECVKTAMCIAKALHVAPASKALEELNYLEDSRGKDLLSQLLEHGVAYHNADLDRDQRDIVERWFRQGEIKVICATTTLAMGLNLPARNVFIDPERWEQDRSGHWGTVAISQAEYENISGRAGRLGLERQFGRAIIVADSKFQARTYFESFAQGRLGDVEPALAHDALSHHVLNLVASKLCRTAGEIRELLLSSYTGEMLWRGGEREASFDRRLDAGLRRCLEGKLIEEKADRFQATELGRLAAVKGVSVETAIQVAAFAIQNKANAKDLDLFEMLICLAKTEDGESVHFNLSTSEFQSGKYLDLLKSTVAGLPEGPRRRLSGILDLPCLNYERAKRAKKTLLLHTWMTGVPTREIETRFHCMAGSIMGLASEFSWLAEVFSAVAKLTGWSEDSVKKTSIASEQLIYGVPAAGVELASGRVRGVGRVRTMLLVEHGVAGMGEVLKASRAKLEKLLSKQVAARLIQKAAWLLERKEQAVQEKEAADPEVAEAEEPVPDWSETYPLSDDMGVAYQSDIAVHLDGRPQKRRYLVTLNEKEVWLKEQSFEAMLKFAVAAKTTELGWLTCDQLEASGHYHQVIRRLKQDLLVEGIDVERLIENNRAKQYRLSVPPKHITLNPQMIRKHLPEAARILADLKDADVESSQDKASEN